MSAVGVKHDVKHGVPHGRDKAKHRISSTPGNAAHSRPDCPASNVKQTAMEGG